MNFSFASSSSQLGRAHANEIKHDYSPIVNVVLDNQIRQPYKAHAYITLQCSFYIFVRILWQSKHSIIASAKVHALILSEVFKSKPKHKQYGIDTIFTHFVLYVEITFCAAVKYHMHVISVKLVIAEFEYAYTMQNAHPQVRDGLWSVYIHVSQGRRKLIMLLSRDLLGWTVICMYKLSIIISASWAVVGKNQLLECQLFSVTAQGINANIMSASSQHENNFNLVINFTEPVTNCHQECSSWVGFGVLHHSNNISRLGGRRNPNTKMR